MVTQGSQQTQWAAEREAKWSFDVERVLNKSTNFLLSKWNISVGNFLILDMFQLLSSLAENDCSGLWSVEIGPAADSQRVV